MQIALLFPSQSWNLVRSMQPLGVENTSITSYEVEAIEIVLQAVNGKICNADADK
jgi:hypothetical protein